MTERRGRLLRWLAAAALLAGLVYSIGASGPLTLAAPRSAVSLTQPAMEDFLLFLQAVARRVPEGASIAVVARDPDNPVLTAPIVRYLALGQLPRQRLVQAALGQPAGDQPDYIAAFGSPIEDSRLELVARLPGGWLYGKKR